MSKTPLLLGLMLAFAAGSAVAKGDAQKGKSLAYTCTGCHGIAEYKNAYPSYHVPKIAGQNEAYIVSALTAYRWSGESTVRLENYVQAPPPST